MATGPQGIDESVVHARTGKSSEEWYGLLDRWGARAKGHTMAVKYLRDDCGLSQYWARCVVVRYELARRIR